MVKGFSRWWRRLVLFDVNCSFLQSLHSSRTFWSHQILVQTFHCCMHVSGIEVMQWKIEMHWDILKLQFLSTAKGKSVVLEVDLNIMPNVKTKLQLMSKNTWRRHQYENSQISFTLRHLQHLHSSTTMQQMFLSHNFTGTSARFSHTASHVPRPRLLKWDVIHSKRSKKLPRPARLGRLNYAFPRENTFDVHTLESNSYIKRDFAAKSLKNGTKGVSYHKHHSGEFFFWNVPYFVLDFSPFLPSCLWGEQHSGNNAVPSMECAQIFSCGYNTNTPLMQD